jgi:hypothetical protein
VDESGTSVDWYPLLGFASWLDDEHFLLCSSNETRPGYDWTPDNVWLADTNGSEPTQVQMPRGTQCPAANGHGAAAGGKFLGKRNGIERDEYWVWSDGVTSDVRSGFAYNWSLDGSKLAVVHPFEPTRGTLGSREILSWPGLDTLWKEDPPKGGASVDFDPTGQFMALPGDETLADGTDRFFTSIVNLTTGKSVEVPATNRSSYFWANGYLTTVADSVLRSYDSTGNLAAERSAPAGYPVASADGSAVFWVQASGDDPATSVNIQAGGTLTTVDYPAPIYYAPILSNDGRGVALNNNDAFYLTWL